MGELGSFDSLNPFSALGRAPYWLSPLTVETLLYRNWDEPFALYGLLAESVSTDDARSYVEFTLREEARFADGSPVTVEDVLWSFHALGKAHPRYHAVNAKVKSAEQISPRGLRFTFNTADRELPLLLGWRPILKKSDWEGRDLGQPSAQLPIGSGPYKIASIDMGRAISFEKRDDWWGKELPVMAGLFNLDEVRVEYYTDASVMFEAFKSGALSVFREGQSQRWQSGYDFPRVLNGEVVKSEIPHARPALMTALAFNTRRAPLQDWRVRDALIESFNFEFINGAINAGALPRAGSWFANSALALEDGPASEASRALLAPYLATLPPDALEDLALPRSSGDEANRPNLRRASAMLDAAGWTVQDGRRIGPDGRPMELEVLLPLGGAELRSAVTIWGRALARLGIGLRIASVDDAQLVLRQKDYDFDITPLTRGNSLSPGNEQILYWGRDGVTKPGTRNIVGVDSPAVEAMIEKMLAARDPEAFTQAVRALDRALMAGRYVIPLWFADRSRLAHDRRLQFPKDRLPVYGDASGFLPELWWWQDAD